MHWKLKAMMQEAISLLPSSASYAAYYWMQRSFGGLRNQSPVRTLTWGVETWRHIRSLGRDPSGAVFLEVGTGRVPLVPLAYWLMGAKTTITVDLNRYVRDELVRESLQYIVAHREKVAGIFGEFLDARRFDELIRHVAGGEFSTRAFFELCCVDYRAPADAADTHLPAGSVDFHTSCTVLEHIHPKILERILVEGGRVLKGSGMFVHLVDYSDHFSHSDPRISAINFLQYSDRRWRFYAGNRYMYMNRLRHDDFVDLFKRAAHRILKTEPYVDPRSRELLESGRLRVDEAFGKKSNDILSVSSSWIISAKAP